MESRTLIIINIVLYIVALLLLIIGFATPNWLDYGGSHAGLWKSCNRYGCGKISLEHSADFFKATVAFMIIALIAAILAFFGYLVLIVGGALQLIAGLSELLAVLIYGGRYKDKYDIKADQLGFSFWLSLVSAIIFVVNGVFLIWMAKKHGVNTKPKLPFSA